MVSNICLFSPLFGEDFQFDLYFSDGLKPPTRIQFTHPKRWVVWLPAKLEDQGICPTKEVLHSSLWQDSAWLETPWILEWLRFEFSEDFEGVGFCQVNKTHIFRWHYFNLGVSNKRPWTSFSGWEPEKLKVWEDDVIQVFSASMLVPGRHMCVHIYIYIQKGRAWGCKFYEKITSKHCKLRCFMAPTCLTPR